jgi:hypothetical protein
MLPNTHIPTEDETATMTERQYVTLETRCRRAAKRQGLKVIKSRSRDPRAVDYGGYMIVNTYTNTIKAGELGTPDVLSLAEVAQYLWGDEDA